MFNTVLNRVADLDRGTASEGGIKVRTSDFDLEHGVTG